MENTSTTPKRHAYLIIAHHQFDLLKAICRLLDHPNHDFFIHIDAKAKDFDPREFDGITQHSTITFTKRISVSWGGYSQIRCELLLLSAAAAKRNYSYYHLISGADLPLRTAQEIYDFFESHAGKEFIHFCEHSASESEHIKSRQRYYHFFQDLVGRNRNFFEQMECYSLSIQRKLGIDRTKHIGKAIRYGANWFSITDSLARFVLKNKKWIRRHFSNTICADELFLQTLVYGTPFQNHLFMQDPRDNYQSCMRYIDWRRGNPYVFRSSDFDELIASQYMFARKFDLKTDREICEKIIHYLIEKQSRT